MNKHSFGIVGAFLGILCLGYPSLAQENPTQKPFATRPSFFKTSVQSGQFTMTPQPEGAVLIEIFNAPLEPVLEAVAKLANRELIISDEAKEKLNTYKTQTFSLRANTPEIAFSVLTSGFSWGKVGKGTYLLVAREKSAVELAADKVKGQVPISQAPVLQDTERFPAEPQQAPMTGRLFLLSPQINQNPKNVAPPYHS